MFRINLSQIFGKKVNTHHTAFMVAFEKYEELVSSQQEEKALSSKTDYEWNFQAQKVRDSSKEFLAGVGLNPNDLDESLIDEARNMFPQHANKIKKAMLGKDVDGPTLKDNQLNGIRCDIRDAMTDIKSWADYMGVKPERLMEACEKHYNEKLARKKNRTLLAEKRS